MRLLRVELLKLFKDKIFLLALAGMMGAPLIVALAFLFGRADLIKAGRFTLDWFADTSLSFQGMMMGPMMMAILGAQVMTIEFKQKTLKGLIPLPTTMTGIFISKAILAAASVGISLLAAGVATLVLPMVFGAHPADGSSLAKVATVIAKSEGILLPLLSGCVGFSLLVSLVSKNFVAPLAASMVAFVAGMFTLQAGKERFVWTALPIKAMTDYIKKNAFPTEHVAVCLGYFVLFVAVGLLWAKFNPRPE